MENKLLIVDDERLILKSLERLFRKSSFSVLTAGTAADALEIVRSEPIAVLLSDFSMPDMTGATLLSNAKLIRPDMTRIILSGNNDQAAVIQSLNEGSAHRYLTKPWDDEQLLNEIEEAFRQFRATQHLDKSSKLLTHPALSEWLKHSLSETDSEFIVLAFCLENTFFLREAGDTSKLQETISSSISTLGCLSETVHALGLLGENQFCVCFRAGDSAKQCIEEIQNSLPKNIQIAGLSFPLVFNMGFTQAKAGRKPEEIFSECRTVLNAATMAKSTVPLQFKETQREQYQRRSTVESQLFSALDRQELYLNYQPKISTLDHSLCGAEALIRWNNSDLGFVSPEEFIPVAENNGLIHPIGLWVLEQSIKEWLRWYGPEQSAARISINISSVQLENRNLLTVMRELIQQNSINPACIELELTETSLMKDTVGARDLLTDLKSLGLHLSIDDFGTGYSSLSYLSQFPIDTIKIDRSFILPMLDQKSSESLVKNIIALAKDLGKETVAEGVETKEQMLKLTSLGCNVIQGYFFSKPLSPCDFQRGYSESMHSEHGEKTEQRSMARKAS